MRLIDADELVARLRNDPLFDLVECYGLTNVIDAQPTVEAIPVHWLENRIRIYRKCGDDILAQTLEFEIEWWRWEVTYEAD